MLRYCHQPHEQYRLINWTGNILQSYCHQFLQCSSKSKHVQLQRLSIYPSVGLQGLSSMISELKYKLLCIQCTWKGEMEINYYAKKMYLSYMRACKTLGAQRLTISGGRTLILSHMGYLESWPVAPITNTCTVGTWCSYVTP